jgi:hypothetical protein
MDGFTHNSQTMQHGCLQNLIREKGIFGSNGDD